MTSGTHRAVAALLAGWACVSVSTAWAAEGSGVVFGSVDAPGRVAAVRAVDRQSGRSFPGSIEADTGRFRVEALPLGRFYDCVLMLRDGAILEGVDLTVPASDYVVEQPLSAEDREVIGRKARAMNRFEDIVEILAIEGNIQHAAALLNKRRTRPFYGSAPGEIVWRVELWHFERPEETWVKVQDELFIVLHRERIPGSVYDRKSVTFDPGLGGLGLTAERPAVTLGLVRIPDGKPGVRLRARDGGTNIEHPTSNIEQ